MTFYWPRRSEGLPPGQRLLTKMPRFSDDPFKPPPPMGPPELAISVNGEVVSKLTEADLTAIGVRTQVTDFHCVTTWSVKDLTWEGVPLAEVIRSIGLDSSAGAFVKAKAADGAHAHFIVEDALAPDVILATRLNGEPLPPRHGGPLRLVAPAHYGYKNVKHLTGLDFRNREPRKLGKMHLRGRVAQEERHPKYPNWLVRLPYRLIIPATAYAADRTARKHT